MTDLKPLNWNAKPGVGLNIVRRADGGMTLTFSDLSEATIRAWHDFALEHLLGSDRLTRNLYDLRAVKDISEKAIRAAVEVDSDPSAAQYSSGRGCGGRKGCDRDSNHCIPCIARNCCGDEDLH